MEGIVKYRYSFNGMEKDDEVKGKGNSYDFGARMHDPRVGRFLSIDPRFKDFPFMSPYCYAANSPIRFSDENGEGPGDRIKAAKRHLGTSYKQEYETKETHYRTGTDPRALQYLDCSELVCRVLAEDGLTSGIKSMATKDLINYFAKNEDNWHKSDIPKAGDIVLWLGHTGIVESYDEKTNTVNVVHATSYRTKSKTVNSVVAESYKLDYYQKKGAKFYNPRSESIDKNNESAEELDEVTVNGKRTQPEFKPKSTKEVTENIINEDSAN